MLTAIWWRLFRRWGAIEIWYPYYFGYLVLLSFLLAIIFFIRFDKFDELDKGNLEKLPSAYRMYMFIEGASGGVPKNDP